MICKNCNKMKEDLDNLKKIFEYKLEIEKLKHSNEIKDLQIKELNRENNILAEENRRNDPDLNHHDEIGTTNQGLGSVRVDGVFRSQYPSRLTCETGALIKAQARCLRMRRDGKKS